LNPEFNRVVIVGVGLIGGSLGMALCRRGLAREVVGTGSEPENLRLALELGDAVRNILTWASGKTTVPISRPSMTTPPRQAMDLCSSTRRFLTSGTLATRETHLDISGLRIS
jgi:prephenate dehydrogenase